MCPRFAWAKVRPGDLVRCMMENPIKLYYDSEAGANPDKNDAVGEIDDTMVCLCLALDDDTILVLAPTGRYGWCHRLWFENVGAEVQEWEELGTTEALA